MDDFFSDDSDGDKAVEELLSQAMDSTILEQVAAINCSGFTDLPSHLETRFQRLKSLPSSTAKHASSTTKSFSFSNPSELKNTASVNEAKKSDSGKEKDMDEKGEESHSTCLKKFPKEKNFLSSSTTKSFSSSNPSELKKTEGNEAKTGEEKTADEKGEESHSTCLKKFPKEKNCLSENETLSPLKKNPQPKTGKKVNKSKSFSSSSSFEGFSSRSVSPPAKSGCFLCSPKKSRKKKKENKGLDLGIDWGKKQDDHFLSDLSNNSLNYNQRKMIKKAMEEEEKICKEAEKIVNWAKQYSSRMDISSIEDELSDVDDDEDAKFP